MDDKGFEPFASDRVLVFDQDNIDPAKLRHILLAKLFDATVTIVHDATEFKELIDCEDYDILILNCNLDILGGTLFFRELQLKDHDPKVLVLTSATDAALVVKLYASGCHLCVLKTENWLEELGHSAASLSRVRKGSEADVRGRARYVELNKILADKNRRLEEFSMTVAHDIRGPLGGITMNLEFVLDTFGTQLPSRCGEFLEKALKTSTHLTDIVQAMYQYARLGAQATKMGRVNLESLVHEVINDLHFDSSLDIRIGIGELPNIWANGDLLRRVFINLVTNAVKYNDKREIVINIGSTGIVEKNIGQFAQVFVADNGPGIPKEDQAKIFSMFTRGRHQSKANDGMGIGLAVVERIVELHYGEISLDSTATSGTKFTLLLPLDKLDGVE